MSGVGLSVGPTTAWLCGDPRTELSEFKPKPAPPEPAEPKHTVRRQSET